MAEPGRRASTQSDQRPWLVLIAYTWDLLIGIVAIFGALAALGGKVTVGSRSVTLPLPLQVLDTLSAAAFAATLIVVATLLTRRNRWIRSVQIAVLATAASLLALSVAIGELRGGIATLALLVSLLVILLHLAVIVVMTERRIVDWFIEPGRPERYVLGMLAFWAASNLALLLVAAFA
ncbi:MAG: hypothetical protein JOZ75_13770 [Candidatus Dormibacteraeota bacterium]|nr:hypothetical protein [Candidatus Dormibacteraeota bacterium]